MWGGFCLARGKHVVLLGRMEGEARPMRLMVNQELVFL